MAESKQFGTILAFTYDRGAPGEPVLWEPSSGETVFTEGIVSDFGLRTRNSHYAIDINDNGQILDQSYGPLTPSAPVFNTQPTNVTRLVKDSALLRVDVWGAITLQWRKEGIPIAGETNATLEVRALHLSDSGIYTLSAHNVTGSVVSAPVTVSVIGPPTLDPSDVLLNPSGGANLRLQVPLGFRIILEASTDLVQWAPVYDAISTNSSVTVVDAEKSNHRFYRSKYLSP